MKTFQDYLAEESQRAAGPVAGDDFAIVIREECLIESYVVDTQDDGIVIHGDDRLISLLEQYGYEMETIRRYGAVGSSPGMGYTMGEAEEDGTDPTNTKAEHSKGYSDAAKGITKSPYNPGSPADKAYHQGQVAYRRHFGESQELRLIRSRAGLEETAPNANQNDPLAAKAADDAAVGPMEEDGVDPVNAQGQDAEDLHGQATSSTIGDVDEAKYQGREVKLGKPMKGDVKKSKVYVKNPQGNVVKVNFGDPNMRIKKSNPERRKSFRARHNCDNPGPRHKARYWSCRAW
jgi:hypothetical protein